MSRITCPTCQAVLRVPAGWIVGDPLKCPSCNRHVRVGERPRPADRSAAAYWEQGRFDEVLAAALPAEPRPAAADRPAAVPPAAGPVPAAAPPSPRGWLIALTAASMGLSIGLIAALAVVLWSRGHQPPAQSPAAAARLPKPPASPPAPASVAETSPPGAAVAALPPPPAPPSPPPPPAPEPPSSSFDRWLQDFDEAQRQAKDQGKDVLLLFDASDWSDFSESLAAEVFGRPELWERLTDRFVPVHVDFPEYPRARRRVQDARRNERLQARFFKHPAYPRAVLTDADGRPYAVEWGYRPGEAEAFLTHLEAHQRKREDRDDLLAAVAAAAEADQLAAAEAALQFLVREVEGPTPRGDGTYALSLDEFYAPLLNEWRALAEARDPENGAGFQERFFRADWGRRWRRATANPDASAADLRALAEEFDAWRARCRFRDPNLAADLLCCRVRLHTKLGDPRGAERAVQAALSLNPSPAWKQALREALGPQAGTSIGTGFAIASGGYLVTSYHVVRGPGAVRVQIPGQQPVGGTILAHDAGSDLALLKVELPPRTTLRSLRVAPAARTERGTEVMALGYALGGESLKLTRGAVSTRLRDPEQDLPLLVLDQRINPGNSGGPLFDGYGNVVGIVTAKTVATTKLDSYGIAVAAEALDRFLNLHLKDRGYRTTLPLQRQKLDWSEIDRWVSPSIVLVSKDPG